jgi:hypothetical protein
MTSKGKPEGKRLKRPGQIKFFYINSSYVP